MAMATIAFAPLLCSGPRKHNRGAPRSPSASTSVPGTYLHSAWLGASATRMFRAKESPRARLQPQHTVQARGGSSVDAIDRLVSAVSYVLPLFDGIQYGRYFFMQFPAAERLIEPLFPALQAYKSFPYASFIAFFALYLIVVKNQKLSRYVRFNAMQAVVLDVLTIVPSLVERSFSPSRGFGFSLLVSFYNTVFFFLVACFVFAVGSCMLGRSPRLPLVAEAADAQI